MGELDGRVALITGASRGIGAAIAQRFAAEGAAVSLMARTLESHPKLPGSLLETVERIERAGGRAIAIPGDVADAGARRHVVDKTRSRLGPIEILVNNAAAAFYLPSERVTEKRFSVAFEVNVRAPFELSQLVLPEMRAAGRGWILNISSAISRLPKGPPYDEFATQGGALLYGATKAALERISAGLAAELCAAGIVVNSLAPVGAVMTPGAEALGVVPERHRKQAESVEAMAEAALALCVAGAPTGRIAYCTPLLEELGRTVHALDGRSPFRAQEVQP